MIVFDLFLSGLNAVHSCQSKWFRVHGAMHSSVTSDELFLFQRDARVVIGVGQPEELGYDWVQTLSLAVPCGLLQCGSILWLFYVCFRETRSPKFTLFCSLIFVFLMVIGTYVGHAYVLQLEPRLTRVYPFTMAAIENCASVVLLPIGVYLRGLDELKQIFWPAGLLAMVFLITWCLVISCLGYLSVFSFMMVEQLLPLILYIMHSLAFGKPFSTPQMLMVVLGLIGFNVVVWDGWSLNGLVNLGLGYIVGLLSVVMWASYQIIYLVLIPIPDGEYVSFLTLFIGIRGAWCVLISTIVALGCSVVGVDFDYDGFPTRNDAFVIVSATVTMWLGNYTHTIAWVHFNPVWVAMAQSFQVPLTAAIDVSYVGLTITTRTVCGAFLILTSFFGFTYLMHFKDLKDAVQRPL